MLIEVNRGEGSSLFLGLAKKVPDLLCAIFALKRVKKTAFFGLF